MRDGDAYGAGDPGALEALFGARTEAGALIGLAEAFRRFGWQAAHLDPLGLAPPQAPPELDPALYGLSPADAEPLHRAYCRSIGWETGHIHDPARRTWLATRAEEPWEPAADDRAAALALIAKGEHLEAAFARRMPGVKTFGLAGAEGFLVLTDAVMRAAVALGARRIFAGGMHRGRFTQMGLNFGKPLSRLIAEAQGTPEIPRGAGASSDVPYHYGFEGTAAIGGREVAMWIAPHPSHLSVVGPIMQGRARAAVERDGPLAVLPMIQHTDAAIAGQGINMEVFQLSGLPPFHIGGTVHLILNNQIGFTTDPTEARTARSCSDIARLIEAPVIHVNGDDPDALIRAGQVAAEYRAEFGDDIVIDMVAYRRKGHNEIDEPRFTQPVLYRVVDAMAPLSARYGQRIGRAPDISAFAAELDAAFAAAKHWAPNGPETPPRGLTPDIEARLCDPVETGVDLDTLRRLGRRITTAPEGFALHPKAARFLETRAKAVGTGAGIDWATAEALALASLADAGTPVRFGGQDSVRGAFTQRHLALFDQRNGARHMVLNGLAARAEVYNAPLIEHAILCFEYGLSTARPDRLAVWEAQFGDFLNVCQPVFDQIVAAAEERWLMESGLVILLPHGLDGAGPDHASARPERLLAACAHGNIRVANPSTPANFFHLLRRQIVGPYRKPLVVTSPKALLRHPGCVSRLDEMGPGTGFRTVIGDATKARRAVLCTGKLSHYLDAARRERGIGDVALIRLEQLYPLDEAALADALAPHGAAELVWAQEEPENMGWFGWLDRRLERLAGRPLRPVSRPPMASPATGPKAWNDAEFAAVIDTALGGKA